MVAMIIKINRTITVRVNATLEANVASFTIGAEICDQCRTQWSTFRVGKIHEEIESPLTHRPRFLDHPARIRPL